MTRRRTRYPGIVAYGVAALLVSVCGAVASCAQDRAAEPAPTSYDAVAPIFAQRCAECHTGVAPAGGWSAASFLGAIACVGPGAVTPAAAPSDTSAPLLRALDTNTHAGRTSASERQTLTAWVRSGAPGTPGPVHAGGFADPRSADFHGKVLRDARWAPMLDGQNDGACGRCHDGAPARPRGVTFAAPGAPACTSCHTQPGGAQACTTCHGAGQNPAPPRDACFFPADTARAGAHAKHVAQGLACSTCHPTPSGNVVSGLHADGVVEVVFDTARVSPEASYDRASGTCAVSCHDQGGARPRPAWNEPGPMKCGDCHGSFSS